MGGTQPVGCTGELSDFEFMQELKGSTDGDKSLVNGIADKCGVQSICLLVPEEGACGAVHYLHLARRLTLSCRASAR